jgi:DNA-binding NtrC family response regulator
MAAHVLVVDDDPAERRHIEEILGSLGHSVEGAAGGEAALKRLTAFDATPISAIILDLVMPDIDGMAVLERLARHSLSVPVIVQAASGGSDSGAAAIRAGALDFLVKPATPERVKISLQNALKIGALEGEILRMRLSRSGTLGLGDIVMHSSAMERVNRLALRAARSPIPVLIEGEPGVGKELLARAIHGSSARKSRPFVAVRCDGVDADEIGSVLFGDAPEGAKRSGKLQEAGGGTLFLDEIAALPREIQARLARRLADEEAGRERSSRGDIRLIAATGRRLIDLVRQNGFCQELFHRLNVFPIWLPPLRERRADIPDLARGFLARLAAEAGRPGVAGLSTSAMEALVSHPWPGNIRELERAIFRAIMLSDGGELTPREFPSIAEVGAAAHAPIRARAAGLSSL